MISRLFYWLFHLHDWIDVKEEVICYKSGSVAGKMIIQKCVHCQDYRTQKLMCSVSMSDHER